MKVPAVLVVLLGCAIADPYAPARPTRPPTFDSVGGGYPDPERLADIENFGIGFAVAHRRTKFSPVRYSHDDNTGGLPHGSGGGLPHGNGGNVHPAVNNGGVKAVNQNVNQGNSGGYSQQGGSNIFGGAQKAISNGIGSRFSSGGKGAVDSQLHKLSNPSLPHTGHEIDTNNLHIGVPVASKPVHKPARFHPIPHPPAIQKLAHRNIDLGANAQPIQSTYNGVQNLNLDPYFPQQKVNVHIPPLQFPVVNAVKKDSFAGDSFFNGQVNFPQIQTGYGSQGQGQGQGQNQGQTGGYSG